MLATRGRLLRLCQKELRETLRDRRTIVTLVLMPLLVYPILSMTLNRFLLTAAANTDTKLLIGLESDEEGQWLKDLLTSPDSQPPDAIVKASGESIAQFAYVGPPSGQSLEDILNAKLVDVIVRIDRQPPYQVQITSLGTEPNGIVAKRILTERIHYFNQAKLRETFATLGLPAPQPIAVETTQLGADSKPTLLASIIPLVLVLMTITGAVYPAIDLTAGERERGTMEALMASPVPRGAVLIAKYVAVVTVALLTALANFGAMFITLWAGGLLELLVGKDQPLPWLQFVQIFGLLILFSSFFSAVLLALTSFARSFKEAQAYLIPLMLVSLAPGVLSLMPGVQLTSGLAIVPLLNIILLSREILAGSAAVVPSCAAIFSTLCYAAAALSVAARLFGNDAVLRSSELSFAGAMRRPTTPTPVATLSAAATTLALLFPVYYVTSNALSLFATIDIGVRLVINALALFAVFGGLPLISALYCRNRLSSTYRFRAPHWLHCLAAIMLGLGAWTWAHEIYLFGEWLGLSTLDDSKIAQVRDLVASFRRVPPWLVVATLAITPGVIEELFFRGYLFSALRSQLSPWRTILLSALLFGVFHVLTGKSLLLERFLPTTLLGILLGWIVWRSQSVWPGILMHVTHNGFLEMVAYFREDLEAQGVGSVEQTHLPWTWMICGSLLVVTAILLIQKSSVSGADSASRTA